MEEEWMKFIKVETDVLGLYMIGDFFFLPSSVVSF